MDVQGQTWKVLTQTLFNIIGMMFRNHDNDVNQLNIVNNVNVSFNYINTNYTIA